MSRLNILSPALLAVLLGALFATPVLAQIPLTQRAIEVAVAAAPLLPIDVDTEPGAIQVVPFIWPVEISEGEGRYIFIPDPGIRVLGRLEGRFPPAPGQLHPVLTILVPENAPAGPMRAGIMRYECEAGCGIFETPLILQIEEQVGVTLENPRRLIGGAIGERLRTEIILHNQGNVDELVELELELPTSWGGSVVEGERIELDAGEERPITLDLRIPGAAAGGDYTVTVTANSGGGAAATVILNVRVARAAGAEGAWSPFVSVQSAVARGRDGLFAEALTLNLAGELIRGVRTTGIYGYVHDRSGDDSGISRSLGRLGLNQGAMRLNVSAGGWSADIGRIGQPGSGIISGGIWGNGASIGTFRDRWRIEATGIRSPDTRLRSEGHLYSTSGAVNLGGIWLGGLLLDMTVPGRESAESRLAAADISIPFSLGTFALQAGHRTHANGAGMAYSADANLSGDFWTLGGSGTLIPGGRSAGARAEQELSLGGSLEVGSRTSLQGGFWSSDDPSVEGSAGSRYAGWNFGPALALGRFGDLTARFSTTTSTTEAFLGGFEGEDWTLSGTWRRSIGATDLILGGSFGRVNRITEFDDLGSFRQEAERTAVHVGTSTFTRFGSFEADVHRTVTGSGVGLPGEQTTIEARGTEIPILPGMLTGYAEVVAHFLDTSGSYGLSRLVGLDLWLRGGYSLTLDFESNQLARSTSERGDWTITTRLRKTIGLPSFGRGGKTGTVFADLNGNGARDRDEPGISSAIVRVGSSFLPTDDRGRFRIEESTSARVDIDPRSLAAGWIVAPRSPQAPGGPANLDLAVRPVSSLEIRIELVELIGVSAEEIHSERMVVIAEDASGRRWTAAPNSAGVLRFDALPPGVYEISADLGPFAGILVLPSELPIVRIDGGGAPMSIVLPLSSRPIRLLPQVPAAQINRQVRIEISSPAEGADGF